MQTPTENELRAVDEQLAAMDCNDLTRQGIARHDRRWRERNDQLQQLAATRYGTSIDDDEEDMTDEVVASSMEQAEGLSRIELETLLIECGLDEKHERVVKMRLAGCSIQEVQTALNCSERTVRNMVNRATAKMRDQLPKSKWYGLQSILASLDTLGSNWPKPE